MKQSLQKFIIKMGTVAASVSLVAGVLVPAPALAASVDPAFNPSQLISDSQFSNPKAMDGASAIQKFLENKNSVLANTSPDFIALLQEPTDSSLKDTLEDPHASSSKPRSAAELIWDASQSSGINPQVILVTLNKEQSLITGNFTADRLPRALDFAMGFGCPDGGGCGDVYRGFYHQLFGGVDETGSRYLGAAKSLMRSFNTPGGRGPLYNGAAAKVGDTIVIANTLGGYDGVQSQQTVTIGNYATAALYRYTPHVFNGNYNFWRFFKEWFGYQNGTLLKAKGDKNIYVIQDGTLYVITPLVAQLRNIDTGTAQRVSPKEIDSYPKGKAYGPADNTVVKADDKIYVFVNNIMHPASDFTLKQRGLSASSAISLSNSEANQFEKGSVLVPTEGSIIRGPVNPAVYLVDGGVLKLFSPLTFAQRGGTSKLQIVPQAEMDTYPKDGNVSPLSGTIMKANTDPTVYLLKDGKKFSLTAPLFSNLGFSFKNVVTLSAGDIAQFPYGGMAMPKDGTAIKSATNPTVFYILDQQVRPMTYDAFVARKITPQSILVFSQSEVDSYPKGSILTK